mmetsp:Transcript_21581/g.23104  ORF Transcript_21581/g.23104 Transcript_21581/m.23104 type:complete len:133 (-) Transcript_21581:333-731(-)
MQLSNVVIAPIFRSLSSKKRDLSYLILRTMETTCTCSWSTNEMAFYFFTFIFHPQNAVPVCIRLFLRCIDCTGNHASTTLASDFTSLPMSKNKNKMGESFFLNINCHPIVTILIHRCGGGGGGGGRGGRHGG